MKALFLEQKLQLSIRQGEAPAELKPDEVRVAVKNVGVCGSDVHYYTHGKIGPFVVDQPMILGHEVSGQVVAIGSQVTHLTVGDRVCMEPGIPNLNSRCSKLGLYNLDPDVRFWATPPHHGCMIEQVNHPAAFTYKLPEQVSYAEGAMVEPLATGVQATVKAQIKPGDTALVVGAGTIGILTALAALAAGCQKVYVCDLSQAKLDIASQYAGIETINVKDSSVEAYINEATHGWGVDVVFEASGAAKAFEPIINYLRPNGCLVLVGMPLAPVAIDVVAIQAKEIRIESVFRYANVFERALDLMASGKIDVKPLISHVYDFDDSILAYERAASAQPSDIKLQIRF